jgi:hypothetical protein
LLNTNGAGDSFISGLLIASMIRHTGMDVPSSPSRNNKEAKDIWREPENISKSISSPSGKKLTPYNIYMKENYVSLKQQCGGDKKAIFTMCHEMWENESPDVKFMFERMAREDVEDPGANENPFSKMSDPHAIGSQLSQDYGENGPQQYTTDESLNLESAVMFAGLVAANHVDMSTRNNDHLDVNKLLEKATAFSLNTGNISEI